MNIPNVNAFAQFIRSNNLTGLCSETSMVIQCLHEVSQLCGGCDDKSAINAKLQSCTQNYINFVSKASNFKNALFSVTGGNTITFYDNQRYLGSINR